MIRSFLLASTLLVVGCNLRLELDSDVEPPKVLRIENPAPEQNAYFGAVMAFDGSSLLVAASGVSIAGVGRAGSAYLYEPEGESWRVTPIAREVPVTGDGEIDIAALPHEAPVRSFPFVQAWPAVRVALRSDLAVVAWAGADASDGEADVGVVCIYDRRRAGLQLRQCLRPDAAAGKGSWFGLSVALSPASEDPTRLVIGAPGARSTVETLANGEPLARGGAAYVYVERNGSFEPEAKIIAPAPAAEDFFGGAVAIDGATLAIGAPAEDSPALGAHPTDPGVPESPGRGIGAVYLYRRVNDSWKLERFLKPLREDTRAGFFGVALSLDGDSLAIGNPGADGCGRAVSAYPAGAVYVAHRVDGAWTMTMADCHWDANVTLGGGLGLSLSLSGEQLIVGAPLDPTEHELSGAVYLKTRKQDGSWTDFHILKAPVPNDPSMFGASALLANDRLAIGAPREPAPFPPDVDANVTFSAGSAYVYSRFPAR